MEKTTYKMIPDVLEVKGDSVEVGFKMNIPKGAIPKKGVVKLEPILFFGGEEQVLKTYTIKGTNAKENNSQAVIGPEGGTITYMDKVLFNPAMKNCTLYIQPNLKITGEDDLLNQCIEIPRDSLGLGTITTSLSYKVNETVAFPPAVSMCGETMKKTSNIYYFVDTWDFKPKLTDRRARTSNPDELKSLVSYLSDRKNFNLTGLSLRSSASPDGRYNRNILLARNRDVTVYNFLKRELKKLGYDQVNDSLFTSRVKVTEDMDGLRAAVEASNLKDKQWFLDIINGSGSEDEKEARMREEENFETNPNWNRVSGKWNNASKKHWTSYRYILDYIMPRLRRSEISIMGEKCDKSWEEVQAAARSGFGGLSANQVLYYASKTDNADEKIKAYTFATNTFQSDYRGYLGLSSMLIQQKKFNEAKVALEKGISLERERGELYNNLGVCFRYLKSYEKAEENYKLAKAKGVSDTTVSYNMGILNMVRGQYADAIRNFNASNKKCTYNMALAYTMNGEFDRGNGAIDCMEPNSKDAQSWYLKAVIASRKGDLANTTTYLTKAIQMDPKLKATAATDLEFLKFFGKGEFKNVIN